MSDHNPVVYACRRSIYIGSTVDLARRLSEHMWKSAWWGEVNEVEPFTMPDEETARERELDAIASVRPTYNITGVTDYRNGMTCAPRRSRAVCAWMVTTGSRSRHPRPPADRRSPA